MSSKKKLSKTAEAILDAADSLICERGYDGVSMRDVAEHAGVNKASVFYHFNSKDALFEKVLERYYTAHTDALEAGFSRDGTLEQRMHNVVDTYFDFMVENRRYAALIQQLVVHPGEHLERIARNFEPLFTWTTQALSEISHEVGPLAARQFFVTFSGLVINYFTYAPVLQGFWGIPDPLSADGLSERKQHLHWIVQAILNGLQEQ